MAELIPLEYRISAARHKCVERWILVAILATALSGAAFANAFTWKRRQTVEYDKLNDEYKTKSVLIAQAKELQSRRLELASRMQKMQQLMDDKVLLSLLRSVSTAFSANDCLEYIRIDAHKTPSAAAKTADDNKYSVHLNGLTVNNTTHADLLNRLADIGAKADPPLMITPESLRREKLFDGQVMKLQLVCEQPTAKGG